MWRIPGDAGEDTPARRPAHGSAAEAVGEELLSTAVDLPWDDWLGPGAADQVREGRLALVRHAWPPAAARDMRAAATEAGMLAGDAADRERLGAIALGVAAAHRRPARMPHGEGEEPFAWWVAEERTLVWMPWSASSTPPYGLELLESGQADAVVVAAPDACWTAFRTDLPRRGASGGWEELPERYRTAIVERTRADVEVLSRHARWRRDGDAITVAWRDAGRFRRVSIAVNGLTQTG